MPADKGNPLKTTLLYLFACACSNAKLDFGSALLSSEELYSVVITVIGTIVIIACVVSYYKMGARSWSDQRNRQAATRQLQQPCPQQQQYTYSLTPTTVSVMYTPASIQERQRLDAGAHQDHLVRLHSVQTDLALNLPHSIALPDGEEGPRSDAKLLKLRDPEQHAEITRSFIRPPPNRTVPEVSILPPYRINSVGLIQKSSTPPLTQIADNAPIITRSHSVSSSNTHGGRLNFPRVQCPQTSSPNVTAHLCLPSGTVNSRMTGTNGSSSRLFGCVKAVVDVDYDSTDPPPPYSDVVNQWGVNTVRRQQNSDV